MVNIKEVVSCGWLCCANGGVRLSICTADKPHGLFAVITRKRFDAIKHEKALMIQEAVELLNERGFSQRP